MAAAAPFDITITNGPSMNGSFQPIGEAQHWISIGLGPANINSQQLTNFLASGASVVINNSAGDIILVGDLIINGEGNLVLAAANDITLNAAINGPNLNLTLNTPGTVMSGMGGTLTLGGLTLDVGTGCQIGQPPSLNQAYIAGITDGSNIVFENTKIEQGTHFFNGVDIASVLAQKVTNTAASGKKANTASTASAASTATTSTNPTASAAPPSMTAAFNTAAAQNRGKTDADQDPSKSPKAKK